MQRVEAYVPPPIAQGIEDHQDEYGFENRSQAIRDLIRKGIEETNDA